VEIGKIEHKLRKPQVTNHYLIFDKTEESYLLDL